MKVKLISYSKPTEEVSDEGISCLLYTSDAADE